MSFFFNSPPISENPSGNLGMESPSQNDVQQHMSGAKSNIYLPPSTPSASATSSLYLFDTRSTTSTDMLNGGGAMVGRKRMRDTLPYEYGYERGNQFDDGDSNLLTPGSPMPFVNTKYRLAGGLDTPQADIQNRELGRESDYGDIKYRRELSDVKENFEMDGEGQFYRDENGRARIRGNPKGNDSGGWIKPALNVVGGVVGKVWEFCKMGVAFKGFQAGGGNGYVFGTTTPIAPVAVDESKENPWEDEKSPGTPVPDGVSMGGMVENYMDQHYIEPQETTPPRPAKRRQTSFTTTQSGPDDMSRNWVVVPQPPPQPEYPLVQQYPTMPPVPAEQMHSPSRNLKPRDPGYHNKEVELLDIVCLQLRHRVGDIWFHLKSHQAIWAQPEDQIIKPRERSTPLQTSQVMERQTIQPPLEQILLISLALLHQAVPVSRVGHQIVLRLDQQV
ncbi:hypothetical protein EYC84_011184 [Monilinia fructicola]|uniref:Uncharacterized protein n=1 Tax=Monilinia fructicola TaxID=38448 RepID=A0A5M9J4Q5_MONFR|nr:hypothetical protein EYC84_011184 [Monilinia fructicola]